MNNLVLINGMQWGKVKTILVPPLSYDDFANDLVRSLGMAKENFRPEAVFAGKAMVAKATYGFGFPHGPDPWNPLEVGWESVFPPAVKKQKQSPRLWSR